MDLAAVMDDIAAGLEEIDGLQVYPYPVGRITPPAAVVYFPEVVTYDQTAVRGADRMTLVVLVLVGMADMRSARDVLVAFIAGSGSGSVKAAVEGHQATSYDVATVRTATPGGFNSGGVDYIGASFEIDIFGQGA